MQESTKDIFHFCAFAYVYAMFALRLDFLKRLKIEAMFAFI